MEGLQIGPVVDGVLPVELNRPPGNLLTMPLCRELTDALLNPPDGAHVLRLRASGGVFCMGRERAGSGAAELREESVALVGLYRALRQTRLVTVAEVSGDAAGFGVGLVAACDVSVAVESARLSFPEVEIGLAPSVMLAWLPRVLGEREAFWLAATGQPLSAVRAAELGLLNAVVASVEDLRRDVDERVTELRRRSPRVHAEIRALLSAGRALTEDQALELSIDRLVVGALRRSEE